MSKKSDKAQKTKSVKISEKTRRSPKTGVSNRKEQSNPKEASSKRRLHVTSPSSASEIREALGITKKDLKMAREAIESSK
jgi:DNA-binding MarR family transcriptional regulator